MSACYYTAFSHRTAQITLRDRENRRTIKTIITQAVYAVLN